MALLPKQVYRRFKLRFQIGRCLLEKIISPCASTWCWLCHIAKFSGIERINLHTALLSTWDQPDTALLLHPQSSSNSDQNASVGHQRHVPRVARATQQRHGAKQGQDKKCWGAARERTGEGSRVSERCKGLWRKRPRGPVARSQRSSDCGSKEAKRSFEMYRSLVFTSWFQDLWIYFTIEQAGFQDY